MARPLRVEYPGAFYHVINRGNAGEDLFKSDRDRERFLEVLDAASERFSIRIHTYCLMTNHYHLLVETPEANLSRAVQWVNVSYAVYFNIKRRRRGHLFQGRFKSLLVDADAYLKHLSRYIHLNPVRAKMVESASEYPWSSYPFFIGTSKMPKWLCGDWLLSQFGKNLRQARQNYRAFVEESDPWTLENPGRSPVGGFILGSEDFVNWVKETFLLSEKATKEKPQLNALQSRIDMKGIVAAAGEIFDVDSDEILIKGKKRNLARDVAIYLSRKHSRRSGKELGQYFGDISGSAIALRCKAVAERLQKDKRLKNRIKEIEGRIINN
jgi:REP element-mobilizing transposase RayT